MVFWNDIEEPWLFFSSGSGQFTRLKRGRSRRCPLIPGQSDSCWEWNQANVAAFAHFPLQPVLWCHSHHEIIWKSILDLLRTPCGFFSLLLHARVSLVTLERRRARCSGLELCRCSCKVKYSLDFHSFTCYPMLLNVKIVQFCTSSPAGRLLFHEWH